MSTTAGGPYRQNYIATWVGQKWLELALTTWLAKSASSTTTVDELRGRCASLIENEQRLLEVSGALSKIPEFREHVGTSRDSVYLLLGQEVMNSSDELSRQKLDTIQSTLEHTWANNGAMNTTAAQASDTATSPPQRRLSPNGTRNYISLLKEKGDVNGIITRYEEVCEQEVPPTWTVSATYSDIRGEATARSKKEAKHLAAKDVWLKLELGEHIRDGLTE